MGLVNPWIEPAVEREGQSPAGGLEKPLGPTEVQRQERGGGDEREIEQAQESGLGPAHLDLGLEPPGGEDVGGQEKRGQEEGDHDPGGPGQEEDRADIGDGHGEPQGPLVSGRVGLVVGAGLAGAFHPAPPSADEFEDLGHPPAGRPAGKNQFF